MKHIKVLLGLLLLTGCSGMEVTTNALLLADYAQTRQIAKQPDMYYEKYNQFLSNNPSVRDVDKYFAGVFAVNTLLHKYLPEKYLSYYQTGLISVEIGCVANNYNIGLKVKF